MRLHDGSRRILNEDALLAAIRQRQYTPAEIFARYADAKAAGREKAFLASLSQGQFDALAASLKGESR